MILGYNIWVPVFEEGDGAATPPAAETPPAAAETPPAAETLPASADASGNGENVVPQAEVNRIMAAEKRKHQKLVQKAIDEAQALRSKAQLTAQENKDYDDRIAQLRDELLTKEELAKKNAERTRAKHKEQVTVLETERDTWRDRFTGATIERSILDAAASNDAFAPGQLVAILGRDTRLVEVLDDEGKPTGNLEPKVRFQDTDKEGKPVTLELSPDEAVKRMREMENYLNLFKGEGTGGVGLHSQPGGKKPDLRNLAKDPAAWRKARKAGEVEFQ